MEQQVNYYGSLCTEVYELLHPKADEDELEFYLSYADKSQKILELLCGSGRFLLPFMERGFDITGVDLSQEMVDKLLDKQPNAKVEVCSADSYQTDERYDYIFITCNSLSLFTDEKICEGVLRRAKELLSPGGRFVFSVDTVASAEDGDGTLEEETCLKTNEGYTIKFKMGKRFDSNAKIQYYPSVYELWDGNSLVTSEEMDFQTRLYQQGELEGILKKVGFKECRVYVGFDRTSADCGDNGMLIYECR